MLVGGQGDPEEEREDAGQSLTLLLQPESVALNGANFTCRVTTINGKKFEKSVTVQVKGELGNYMAMTKKAYIVCTSRIIIGL